MSVPLRRSSRGIAALAIAAFVASGFALGSVSQPAQADILLAQPGELVVNGGAEQPVTVGWTGGLGRATHGSGGYPASVIVNANGLTGATYPGGIGLFTGTGGSSVATQTINLTPSAAAIDNGNVDAKLSAYLGGYNNQADNAKLSYRFLNAVGGEVDSVTFGPVLPVDRGNTAGFVPFSETVRLPVGTRSVVVTITTQRFVAPANDGYIDNVSLILDAPSPTAAADQESTNQGVPVTVDAPSNDTPGAGAALLPGSLRLLDGAVEVTTLETEDGTYTVDTATGKVEFQPAATFIGTTTPVAYRISDSSGQRAESTITIQVVFVANPSITVVKSATPTDAADLAVGAIIDYSFVVTNRGNVRISDVAISEDVFTGAGTAPVAVCPAGPLEPGAQITCTATYTLVQADIDNQGVSNTASASGIPEGSDTAIRSEPSTFAVPVDAAPSLAVVKSADVAGVDSAGDEVRYKFLVTNTGNVTLNAVSITETSFTGTGETPVASCPEGALLPGAMITCEASYELTQADVDAGTVTNTASASGISQGSDAAIYSEPSTFAFSVDAAPSLTVVKSADVAGVDSAGDEVRYEFLVTNTGNVTLNAVSITEASFTGTGEAPVVSCPEDALLPGASVTCEASYELTQADVDAGTVTNTASASAIPQGSDTAVRSEPSTFVLSVGAVPSLSVVKSSDVAGADSAGDEVRYEFLVTNTGNVTLDAVSITEGSFTGTGKTPVVSCPEGALLPGAMVTCGASYELTQADVDGGTVTNTATAAATYKGDTISSAPSSTTATIAAQPSFTFVKTATADPITAAGQIVTYTFEVANIGNVTLTDMRINDTEFSGAGELGDVVCAQLTVAPGKTIECTASYTVVAADLAGDTLSNSATADLSFRGELFTSEPSVAVVAVDAVVPPTGTDGDVPPTGTAGDKPAADTLPNTGAGASGLIAGAGAIVLLLAGALLMISRRGRRIAS